MVSNKFIMCACMFFIWKQIDYQKSESKPTVARADSKQAKMQTFDISYLEWTKKVSCMITPNQNQPTFTILHSLEEICMTCHEVVSSLIHRFGKYHWVMHTPHSTRSCGFRFHVDEHKRFRKWAHEQNNHKKHAREMHMAVFKMASRSEVLQLYRQMLRIGRSFTSYNYR